MDKYKTQTDRQTDLLSVPLEPSLEWALMLVNQTNRVTKLVQDSRSINEAKVHGE